MRSRVQEGANDGVFIRRSRTLWDLFLSKAACGHREIRNVEVIIFGDTFTVDTKKRCGDCYLQHLRSTAVRCCICGAGIHRGDSVRLHLPPSTSHVASVYNQYPEAAMVRMPDGQSAFVACFGRKQGCDSGGESAGKWSGKGVYLPRTSPRMEDGYGVILSPDDADPDEDGEQDVYLRVSFHILDYYTAPSTH